MTTLTIGTDLKITPDNTDFGIKGDTGFEKIKVIAPAEYAGVDLSTLTARLRYQNSGNKINSLHLGTGTVAGELITYEDFEGLPENAESYPAMFSVDQKLTMAVTWENEDGTLFKSTFPNGQFTVFNSIALNGQLAAQNPDAIKSLELNKLNKTGDGKDVTVTFSIGSRIAIATGDTLSAIFGKILKWLSDLKSFVFSDLVTDYSGGTGKALDAEVGKSLKGLIDSEVTARQSADALKVDKVTGKGLSTNDYDNTAKAVVDGVTSGLSDKVDKVTGKSLISDTEIARLATDLAGTATGENTGDQDLSGLVPKTDIVTDFTGGVGKVAGAEETKAIKESVESLTTSNIPESATPTNLYHTTTRVKNVVLTGLSKVTGIVTEADTLLNALGKILGNLDLYQLISGRNAVNGYAGTDANGRIAVTQLPSIEYWTQPTLLNSWVAFNDSAYPTARYYKDNFGIVHLSGTIKSGTASIMFGLPAGYRPLASLIFAVSSNYAHGNIVVQSGGNVSYVGGSTTWYCLDGISFKAEQ